ncbi:hypothetical protein FRC11_014940 [Ceratobasidium sp. 423]|nr:hypothetical protein FRC11_014940 [Ceratobasidium sp. 423]
MAESKSSWNKPPPLPSTTLHPGPMGTKRKPPRLGFPTPQIRMLHVRILTPPGYKTLLDHSIISREPRIGDVDRARGAEQAIWCQHPAFAGTE